MARTTTDGLGTYLFDRLYPDEYRVALDAPVGTRFLNLPEVLGEGHNSIDPQVSETRPFSLQSEAFLERSVGLLGMREVTQISGRVWNDANGDGLREDHEVGIEGIAVQLIDTTGGVTSEMRTDVSGNYLFANLLAGDYAVQIVLPDGTTLSPNARWRRCHP